MSAIAVSSRAQTSKFADEERVVTNGVTVNDGDFVSLASGAVTNASIASALLYGVVRGGQSDNLVSKNYRAPTVVGDGVKKVLVELCEGMKYKLPMSAALTSDAEGKYYCLTGTTGAQTVDNSTKDAAYGQLLCLKRVADSAGAYNYGIFTVAAPQSQTLIADPTA